MSYKEQTAVEWLQEQLNKILIDNQIEQTEHFFKQAKAMHKEEIIEAYRWGRYDSDKLVMSERFYREQYYNETYGKDE